MKYLIVGKSASGKSTLANEFQKQGLKVARSFTTRPKRLNESELDHIFVQKSEFDKIERKLLYTQVGGGEYCINEDMLHESDIFILDIKGVEEILKLDQKNNYILINLSVDEKLRLEKLSQRFDYHDRMNAKENSMDTLKNLEDFPNVSGSLTIEHQYDTDSLENFATQIFLRHSTINRIFSLMNFAKDNSKQYFSLDDEHKIIQLIYSDITNNMEKNEYFDSINRYLEILFGSVYEYLTEYLSQE